MSDDTVKADSEESQDELGQGVEAGSVEGGMAGSGELAVTAQSAGTQQESQEVSQAATGVEEFVAGLPAKQQMVLRGILEIGNVSEVARRTGVGRSTIHEWMREDERFEAALNAWKRETMRVSRAQAVALAKPCVDAVRSAVEKGDADLAFRVGKSMGVFGEPKVGPDDPGEVRERRARKAKAKKVRNAKRGREAVESEKEKLACVKTIYEIDELIEHLMLERMKAVQREEAGEKVARERNQRVLRKGDVQLERIARAIRLGSGEKVE